ncbi:MAG: DUF1801 domain-containing protein [Chitinophagaceae bacterium]|nr:MAG: DUF1801 domain-containing protein [Chitinophagaceae bacterium]
MAKVAEIKTKQNDLSVDDFVNSFDNEQKRDEIRTLIGFMQNASGEQPKMWGAKMVGFGYKRYKSPASGREVDWFKIGFSPRKADFSLHLVLTLQKHEEQLKQLGKHKTGVGCLYINKLADINTEVLEDLINIALEEK